MRSGGVEHCKVLVGGPLEVVAQVVAVRLEGATVLAGQERGSGDLGFVGRPWWIVGADRGVGGEQCGHGVLLDSWDIHPTPPASPIVSLSTGAWRLLSGVSS